MKKILYLAITFSFAFLCSCKSPVEPAFNEQVPELLTPADASKLTDNSASITWKNVANASEYEIQIAEDASFQNLLLYRIGLKNEKFSLDSLTYSKEFYWHVRALNSKNVFSAWSATWKFSTDDNYPPDLPSSPQPLNDSRDLAPAQITLAWSCKDQNKSDKINFDLYFDNVFPPAKCIATKLSDTTYTLKNLEKGTSYYWKVVVHDKLEAETTGPTWTFKTKAGPWESGSSLWSTRFFHSTCQTPSGSIYVVGGSSGNYNLISIEQFDTDLNVWNGVASLSYPRELTGSSFLNNKLYVIGGAFKYGSDLVADNQLDMFDTETKRWTEMAKIPVQLYDFAYATVGGKIYVFGGGFNPGYISNQVYEYNPATNTWTSKSSMPTSRQGCTAVVYGSKVYVFGGYNGSQFINQVEVYDINTNSWSTKSGMLNARGNASAALLNNKIYIFGGVDKPQHVVDRVEEYDPVSGTSKLKSEMNTPRFGAGCAVLNNSIYVIGGVDFNSYYRTVEIYYPERDN